MPLQESKTTNVADEDLLYPYTALKNCLEATQQLTEDLVKRGLRVPANSSLAQIIARAEALKKLCAESIASIKNQLSDADFAAVLEQALQLVKLSQEIIQIENIGNYVSEPDSNRLREDFPVHYHELLDVHVKDLGKLAKHFIIISDNIFVRGLHRFITEKNIGIEDFSTQLENKYNEISNKVREFLVLFKSNPATLAICLGNIKQLLDTLPKPPTSAVATLKVSLAQHLIPQFVLVGSGICAGDSFLTLESEQPLSLSLVSSAALKQLETIDEGKLSCNTYNILLMREGRGYAVWSKNIFDTFLTIFDSEFEHGDVVKLNLLTKSITDQPGHAVNFFRIKSGSAYKYYYRDVNFGLFEINDLKRFIVWFGLYLQQSKYEMVNIQILLPNRLNMIIQNMDGNAFDPDYWLIARAAQKASFDVDELLMIDTSKLHEKFHKMLYCVFGLMVDFTDTENQEIISRIGNLLATMPEDDEKLDALRLAFLFQKGYFAWANNDVAAAKQHFAEYNVHLSVVAGNELFAGLPSVNITKLDFNNVWAVKKGVEELIVSLGFLLSSECRPKLFREALRREKFLTPQATIKDALLFGRLSKQHKSEQLDLEYSAVISERNDSQNATTAFDRRFGLLPRVTI